MCTVRMCEQVWGMGWGGGDERGRIQRGRCRERKNAEKKINVVKEGWREG